MNSSFKKPAQQRPHAAPQAETTGFTLIELLVVITIIAVLAGLLFPAMGAVRNQARKASAKNDVTQLVNAIKAYQLEYGHYPDSSGKEGAKTITSNGTIVGTLRAATTGDNTREIRFLEIPNAKNNRSGLEISSGGATADPTADWLDPWGNPYVIYINYSYKPLGSLDVPGLYKKNGTATEAKLSPQPSVNGEVGASSKGNKDGSTIDPIMSWQ